MAISQAAIEKAIDTTADTVIRNEIYFCDLDGLAGDGDFGNSLATGFKVIKRDLPELNAPEIWGTGFMKAAIPSKGKTEVSLEELAAMVGAAVDGIMARGGAKRGDKTLLDALIPIRETMEAMASGGDGSALLKACAEEADKAIEDTRHLVAHRGRASQVGERSANTPDPGIVAIATILHDWCRAFGIEAQPRAPEVTRATAIA
jgi:hypothetical protein